MNAENADKKPFCRWLLKNLCKLAKSVAMVLDFLAW